MARHCGFWLKNKDLTAETSWFSFLGLGRVKMAARKPEMAAALKFGPADRNRTCI
jgi:hypothetical protein